MSRCNHNRECEVTKCYDVNKQRDRELEYELHLTEKQDFIF